MPFEGSKVVVEDESYLGVKKDYRDCDMNVQRDESFRRLKVP